MKFGLSESDFKLLTDLVITPIKNKSAKIYVFGSRANGKNHKFSDIDLLIEPTASEVIKISELSKIKEQIEESRFPIKVDIVLMQDLAESYKSRVLMERIEI